MSKWLVMAGVEHTSSNSNRETCFELNATDLPSEEAAKVEAERRNAIEHAAGHTNVLWFPMEQIDPAELLRRAMERRR